MIELNPDKLKNPIQAGIVGAILYAAFLFASDRLQKNKVTKPLCEYVKPAIVVGTICAIVMNMSNGPNKRVLAEPFESAVMNA